MRIGVIGGGSFGTALAKLLAEAVGIELAVFQIRNKAVFLVSGWRVRLSRSRRSGKTQWAQCRFRVRLQAIRNQQQETLEAADGPNFGA